eukprot:TRINITY_DN14645_c0_g1_i4.p2 TRINITY_DN14645_c0_g1~~TRINITY_DN14645_c0_g1_i4.p2  ORF type:complete len:210 (-),score=22.23 TRINITY_DN14645_c0_g1_i4:391-1020(-)
MGQKSCSGITLRVLLCFNLFAGLAIIGLSLWLETPPETLPLYGMLVIGILQVLAALVGFISTCGHKRCQILFLLLFTLSWLPLAILTIAMFVNLDGVVKEVEDRIDDPDHKKIKDRLNVIKYFLVVFVGIELFGLFFGMLRWLSMRGEFYEDLERQDDKKAKRPNMLSKLRKEIEMKQLERENESEYSKIKKRIAEKYGNKSHNGKNTL